MDTQLFASQLLKSEFESFTRDPTGYCLSIGWDKGAKAVRVACDTADDINYDINDVTNLKSIIDSILMVNAEATSEDILESNTLQDFLCNCVAAKIQAQVKSEHMGYHDAAECKPKERFLGNSKRKDFPPKHLEPLKTLRLGNKAFDIYGRILPGSEYKPMFIDQSEYDKYNEIMMNLNR